MKNNKNIENIKINKLEKSRLEIIGSISASHFSSFRNKALENINNEITVDGFRKGKIPENILISKVGDMAILEEMAELAISNVYPEIIIDNNIEAIGRPEINITKIAKDNPLEFKIITTIIPEIKLANYKDIAKSHIKTVDEKVEITDKEVEEAIKRIVESHSDHTGHDHESDDFKSKVKEALIQDKQLQLQEKRRIALSDEIMDGSTLEIPELLIDSETRRIEAQFNDDIKRMGVKIEDYLNHSKKTIEELRKEWRPHAERKAKLQLILNEIVKKENIKVEENEINQEVEHILAHYKDADKEMAYTYAETVLTNEKVYQFLESVK